MSFRVVPSLKKDIDSLFSSFLFTPWKDPKSGVESFILSKQVAPVQLSFYFVNSGWSGDGRYLWFYCAFPPAGDANYGRSLAVADLHEQRLDHFPETQFLDGSPLVDPTTGEVYWCSGLEIWKRGPGFQDRAKCVNRFPAALAKNRRPWRMATHLTFSADRSALNIDAQIGREWFVGHAPVNGDPVVIWQTFDRCYNHGQFSPSDPDLQLIAQDYAVDPVTGETTPYDDRIWMIRRGENARPFSNGQGSSKHGHEWWGADGKHIWYVHYGQGVARYHLESESSELMWPLHPVVHAHADATGNLLVADCQPTLAASDLGVLFYNRKTKRSVAIVSDMPCLSPELKKYHTHPHPRFCLNDQYICYTTTALGRMDVAMARVKDIVAATCD